MSNSGKKPKSVPFVGGVLVLLFVAYLIPVAVFTWLATTAGLGGEPTEFDRIILATAATWHSSLLTTFFQVITELGGPIILTVTTGIITYLYWVKNHKKASIMILASVVGATVINLALKAVFERDRPDFWVHLVQESGYSFPSGHAMASAAIAIALLFLLWRTTARWYVAAASIIYIILVGFSRVYLGVHYPTDIIAGWCVSLLWVSLVAWVLYRYSIATSSDSR